MSKKLIRAALEQHLVAMPGMIPIAFENVDFDGLAKPYATVVLAPSMPDNPTTDGGMTVDRGTFVISLSYPRGIGAGEAEALIDQIARWFEMNTVLPSGPINVRITGKPYPLDGRAVGDRYNVPLNVQYLSIYKGNP